VETSTPPADPSDALLRRVRLIVTLLVVGGTAVAVAVLPVREWILQIVGWIRAAGALGVLVYAGVYVAVAVFMLPGAIMTVTAGFAFGPVLGTLYGSVISAVVAIVPFLLGRFMARDWIQRKTAHYPKWNAIDTALGQHGFKVTALLRLSLGPYNFLNYALGLTRVSLRDFVLGTWVGMLPAVTVLVYFGSLITEAAQLGSGVHPPSVIYWVGLGVAFTAAVVLTRMARRALKSVLGS
jgi:uncharacterized membrane protein YdjX (TVP38/TMEM64 family)